MTISCIIPVYNGERFLEEALESVLGQGYDDLEVVVVDDGSTDGTGRILESYGNRIRVVRQENSGVVGARNRGLQEATGHLIAFQDADDLWMPGKLDLQKAAFDHNPELEICVGLLQNFWMDELEDEEAGYKETRFANIFPGYHLGCLLARRKVFDRVGGFDPTLRVGEDVDWFMRAREASVVEYVVPELIYRRRLHLGNLTREDLANRDTLLDTMKAALERRRAKAGT